MVNTTAVKTGLLVGVTLFALLFVGTVWRFLSRLVSFAVLGLFVLAAVYVAYEVHSGWLAADPDGDRDRTESSVDVPETEGPSDADLDEELHRLREATSDESVSTHDEQEFETETET